MGSERLIELEWRVPRDGFHWQIDHPDILLLYPSGDGGEFKRTWPLRDEPRLFQEFAALDGSRESTLRFANQHGSVFGDDPESPIHMGSLSMWSGESRAMAAALRLWRGVDNKDAALLKGLFEVDGDRFSLFSFGLISLLTEADLGPATRRIDQGKVRRGAAGQYQIALDLLCGIANQRTSNANLVFESKGGRLVRTLRPKTLLDALWFQFGELISGGLLAFSCQSCGELTLVPRDETRSDRRFCSGRCRARMHRLRQKAFKLREEGSGIRRIADELAVPEREIKAWLADRREN